MILNSPYISGSLTVTGNITACGGVTISGSIASASYAVNTSYLNGSGSGEFVPTGSFNAFSSSILTYTASNNTNIGNIHSTTASLNTASGSAITRLSSLESKTGSYATTGSNIFDGGQYLSSSFNPTGFSTTASLYTDGGLRVTKDAYISGTLYLNNVTVYGTQSVAYITSSQLNISTNLISVNTDTPSVRFGGLSVYDSGSTGLTGSILWDSENNRWIYSNPSGSSYSGGMFISGPRASSLGSETGTTSCMLLAGQGGDHLTSSMIYHSSTVTCIPTAIVGGSTACFASNTTAANFISDGSQFFSYTLKGRSSDNYGAIGFYSNNGGTRYGYIQSGCICGGQVNITGDGGATVTLDNRGFNVTGIATFACNVNISGERLYIGGTSNNAIINNIASVRINIDSDNNNVGESFMVGHNQEGIDNNNILFKVQDDGKVGIGHSSPENALHVCINCASTGITIAQFENKDYTAGTRSYARVRAWTNAGASYSSYFGQGQDGKTYIYANNTARCGDIVIDANSGNVGIGTNVPALQLHIHSNSGDYNTIFSTTCTSGRAGWVIARPGSTTPIASALVLASDCSYRLGGGSYYNIKMMQDGSTSILNINEGEAFKITSSGQTLVACNLEIGNGYLSTSAGSGTSYSSRLFTNYNYPYIDTYLDSIAGSAYAARMTFRTNSGGGGMVDRLTITCGGCIYLGDGYSATNHRINLSTAQGNNVLVVSGYSGSNNDTAKFRAVSGAGGSETGAALWLATNSSTGRSLNAGGTINASGSDYAEYMLKRNDTGCIAKGQIVGIDSCKLLTDKWSLAQSFVIKSTDPSYVGGDGWSAYLGNKPQQTTDVSDEEFAPILAEYEANLEAARSKVDRIAFSGQVPVIVSGSYNIGDYILPIEGPDDTIIGVACHVSCLTLPDYSKTVGRVWGTCLDKAWVAVKIG